MKNCNKVVMVIKLLRLKQFKNIKGFFNLIRVAKIDGILNVKANTNKKIEQILEQFEKIKNCKIYHTNHS